MACKIICEIICATKPLSSQKYILSIKKNHNFCSHLYISIFLQNLCDGLLLREQVLGSGQTRATEK